MNVNPDCFPPPRSGYNDDNIYAKVDDMTYYPVNSSSALAAGSLPNTNSTTSTTREGGGGGTPSAAGYFTNQQQACQAQDSYFYLTAVS